MYATCIYSYQYLHYKDLVSQVSFDHTISLLNTSNASVQFTVSTQASSPFSVSLGATAGCVSLKPRTSITVSAVCGLMCEILQ